MLRAEPRTLSVAGFLRSCSGCEGVKNGVWQGEQSRPLLPAVGAVPGSPRAAACSARPLLPSLPSVPGFTAGLGADGRAGHSTGQPLQRGFLHRHSGRSFHSHIYGPTAVSFSVWRPPDDTKGQWELSNKVSGRGKRHQTARRQSQSLAKFTIRMGHPQWHLPCAHRPLWRGHTGQVPLGTSLPPHFMSLNEHHYISVQCFCSIFQNLLSLW